MPRMESEAKDLMLLLQNIESQSREFAFDLPHQEESKFTWEGVLFTILGLRLLTALGEVKEILNYPSNVTSVPGAQPWVRGVANVRGSLLPIFDLQEYLGGGAINIGRRTRVLVIEHEGLFAGLMVADVFGMRHFERKLLIQKQDVTDQIGRYVTGAYDVDGEQYPILSMHMLAEDQEFQVVAA